MDPTGNGFRKSSLRQRSASRCGLERHWTPSCAVREVQQVRKRKKQHSMLLNANRMTEAMQRQGFDAVIATMPENVTYTSGFWAMSQWIRRGPQAYVLTPKPDAGKPAIVTSTGIVDLAVESDVWVGDIYRYGSFFFDRNEGVELSR